jgi:ribosomal protein S9
VQIFVFRDNPLKYTDPDGKENFLAILKNLFTNDGSSKIYTAGVSAGGTVTMVSGSVGGGVYINQKNDKLLAATGLLLSNPLTKPLGLLALAANVEEAGIYGDVSAGGGVGQAGAVSLTVGIYQSREVAQGPYLEGGASAGIGPVSVGSDVVTDIKGKGVIGANASIGIGVGTPEAHGRAGVTGYLPIIKNENE